MIKFMVLGMPRSGTTWTANWLTTDKTICIHDPVGRYTLREMDEIVYGDKLVGISCTTSWMLGDWVDTHPAPKIIIDRNVGPVNKSLTALGLPLMSMQAVCRLKSLKGKRVDYEYLFDRNTAEMIWQHLLPAIPFDEDRHRELCGYHIQPNWKQVAQDPSVIVKLSENFRRVQHEAQHS